MIIYMYACIIRSSSVLCLLVFDSSEGISSVTVLGAELNAFKLEAAF